MELSDYQAQALGKNLRVSWKDCTEIGRFISGDDLEKAETRLREVIDKSTPVPYTKFDSDVGHRAGQGSGRYPVKAAKEVLDVVQEAAANAEHQGLNPDNLCVQNVITNQGQEFATPKRHRGRSFKSAHVQVVVEEK
ncbi:50S ribosomal protein L22 [Nanohaloarchaea archaeon]|nr:50S ribosomal protein L22 [Candidatus Nanohaloarchaea archaeon]